MRIKSRSIDAVLVGIAISGKCPGNPRSPTDPASGFFVGSEVRVGPAAGSLCTRIAVYNETSEQSGWVEVVDPQGGQLAARCGDRRPLATGGHEGEPDQRCECGGRTAGLRNRKDRDRIVVARGNDHLHASSRDGERDRPVQRGVARLAVVSGRVERANTRCTRSPRDARRARDARTDVSSS